MTSELHTSNREFHAYLQKCINLADEIYGSLAKNAGEKKYTAQDTSAERKVFNGTVKSWIVDKGFGFLTPQDGGEDVFVHRAGLVGAERLTVGDKVTYELFFDEAKQKTRAEHVKK